MEFTNNLEEAERRDKFKSKILKFVLYKKRTESEVRKKFESEDEYGYLEDIIEFLKEYNYVNDEDYIERSLMEYKNLRNLSIKEISYKLIQKDVNKDILEKYMENHCEELLEYETNSAKNIISKKLKDSELSDIKNFLYKKGYSKSSIDNALEDFEK